MMLKMVVNHQPLLIFFGCPFEIDGVKYDSRLLLDEIGSIKPGDSKFSIPVKFFKSRFGNV